MTRTDSSLQCSAFYSALLAESYIGRVLPQIAFLGLHSCSLIGSFRPLPFPLAWLARALPRSCKGHPSSCSSAARATLLILSIHILSRVHARWLTYFLHKPWHDQRPLGLHAYGVRHIVLTNGPGPFKPAPGMTSRHETTRIPSKFTSLQRV